MSLLNMLFRLGTEVAGLNTDLEMIPTDDSDGGDADGSGSEGGDKDENAESSGDGSDDGADGSDDGDSDGDADGGTDGDADGDADGSNGSDGDADGDADGDGSDGSDGDSDGDSDGNGSSSGEEGDGGGSGKTGEAGDNVTTDSADDPTKGDGTDAAGGGGVDLGEDPKFLDNLIEGLDGDNHGLTDNNSAMSDATEGERKDACEYGEKVWRPYDPSLDDIMPASSDYAYKAKEMRKAAKLLTAALRAKFRAKFLQANRRKVIHGTRTGPSLSERRLVESVIECRSGVAPSRAYKRNVPKNAVSLAVAVVGDESSSMRGDRVKAASTAMIGLAEAFDGLGSPVMCCGVRNGRSLSHYDMAGVPDGATDGCHRTRGVRIDVFKDWTDKFASVSDRFGSYTARGNTPLSDGIQFALNELSERTERFRVVLVLTDGEPNHPDVVRRQVRLAREAGIFVVGVGIGRGCYKLPTLFPENHVWVDTLSELPAALIKCVESIVFPKRAKRGNFDGKVEGWKRRAR